MVKRFRTGRISRPRPPMPFRARRPGTAVDPPEGASRSKCRRPANALERSTYVRQAL